MDINLLIPKIVLVYLLPGLLPSCVIFFANRESLKEPIIGIFVFLLITIFISIFLENLRMGVFQKFRINERKFFRKEMLKYFSLIKHDEVFPVLNSWKDYNEKQKAAVRLWILSNIEKAGGLEKILDPFDKWKEYISQNSEVENAWKKDEIKRLDKMKSIIRENEFLKPTLTSGNWWVILNLIAHKTQSFIFDEYFLFYQSAYNTILSCFLLFILNYIYPFLNYKIWINAQIVNLGKIYFHPNRLNVVIASIILICFFNIIILFPHYRRILSKKDREKFEDLKVRVGIFFFTAFFLILFFPSENAMDHRFIIINIVILPFFFLLYRFTNCWGLAVSRLTRKSILYRQLQ
ncbi:hypothetical protein CVT91_02790 [Candidatus Atribacteria bacterium HGW-Atribacteria-1]|nr:MAG: hypothetical protein CVT91_02790 [Candidatus Atribacteria bacterium HGW-Atribacteria-1]